MWVPHLFPWFSYIFQCLHGDLPLLCLMRVGYSPCPRPISCSPTWWVTLRPSEPMPQADASMERGSCVLAGQACGMFKISKMGHLPSPVISGWILWFMVDIPIVFMGFINQLITGGHHPVNMKCNYETLGLWGSGLYYTGMFTISQLIQDFLQLSGAFHLVRKLAIHVHNPCIL